MTDRPTDRRKKKREKQAPYRHRVEMCRLLFGGMPGVIVSEAEKVCFERKAGGGVGGGGGGTKTT